MVVTDQFSLNVGNIKSKICFGILNFVNPEYLGSIFSRLNKDANLHEHEWKCTIHLVSKVLKQVVSSTLHALACKDVVIDLHQQTNKLSKYVIRTRISAFLSPIFSWAPYVSSRKKRTNTTVYVWTEFS